MLGLNISFVGIRQNLIEVVILKKITKKGQLGGLTTAVISIMVIAIVLALTLVILSSFMGMTGLPANAVEGINETSNSLADIGVTWMPIIVLVIVAVVVLGLIGGLAFMTGRRR
jgi:hypothetical protein